MRSSCLAPLLAACASGRAPTPPPGDLANATEEVSGFVVVRMEAWLRIAPDEEAPGARAEVREPHGCHSDHGDHVWTMRLVGVEGDFVAVENLAGGDDGAQRCYQQRLGGLHDVRLRMFVRRADLVPVTTREVNVELGDGTGFTLGAGVIAERKGSGYRVSVDGNRTVLAVPADAVGWSFAAPSRSLAREQEEQPELPGGELQLGGAPIELSSDAEITTAAPSSNPGVIPVTYAYECSAYRTLLMVDPMAGGTGRGTIGCGRYGTVGHPEWPHVRGGASLTWLDGNPAGETLDDIQVEWPAEAVDGRRCFRLSLREQQDWKDPEVPLDVYFHTVCVDAADWTD